MTGLLVEAGRRQDRLVAMLEKQAALDPLTGLLTRRALEAAAARVLGAPAPAGTALVMVDIDHFKAINDSRGHLIGDDALVQVAAILRRQLPPDAVVGRVGGDEFIALLPGCPQEVARLAAEEFVRVVSCSPLLLPAAAPVPLSVSVGVAHTGRATASLRDLYAAADDALYRAKRAGRGRVGGAVPVPRAESEGSRAESEGVADGALEVGDVTHGVLEGDL
jgi:diguanylate cyclase (GGDEF)-like protein